MKKIIDLIDELAEDDEITESANPRKMKADIKKVLLAALDEWEKIQIADLLRAKNSNEGITLS